jgi:large subunit ribosomal protein L32
MAVQQNKASKQKLRSSKAHKKYEGLQGSACPTCGATRLPHRVCNKCGNYGGKQILSMTTENE